MLQQVVVNGTVARGFPGHRFSIDMSYPDPTKLWVLFDPSTCEHSFHSGYADAYKALETVLEEYEDDPQAYKGLIEGFMIMKLSSYPVVVGQPKLNDMPDNHAGVSDKVANIFGFKKRSSAKIEIRHVE